MASRYNSERYYSPTEYEAFTRIEREERDAARAAAFRPIVYICSPYSHGCINTNIEKHGNTAVLPWTSIIFRSPLTSILPSLWTTQFLKNVKQQCS